MKSTPKETNFSAVSLSSQVQQLTLIPFECKSSMFSAFNCLCSLGTGQFLLQNEGDIMIQFLPRPQSVHPQSVQHFFA